MVQNAVYGAQYHFMLSVVQVQISRLSISIRIASLFCRSLPLIALPTWFSRLLCLIHHKFYKMLLVEYRFKIRQLSNRSKCEKKQKNCTVPDSSFLLAEDLLDIQMQASLLTWVTSISSFSRKYIQPSFILYVKLQNPPLSFKIRLFSFTKWELLASSRIAHPFVWLNPPNAPASWQAQACGVRWVGSVAKKAKWSQNWDTISGPQKYIMFPSKARHG